MSENILGVLFFNLETADFKLHTLFFTETEILDLDTLSIKDLYKELQESEKIEENIRLIQGIGLVFGGFAELFAAFSEGSRLNEKWKGIKDKVASTNTPTTDLTNQELPSALLDLAIKTRYRFPYEKVNKITIESITNNSWLAMPPAVKGFVGDKVLRLHAGLLSASWILMSSVSETQKLINRTSLAPKLEIKD